MWILGRLLDYGILVALCVPAVRMLRKWEKIAQVAPDGVLIISVAAVLRWRNMAYITTAAYPVCVVLPYLLLLAADSYYALTVLTIFAIGTIAWIILALVTRLLRVKARVPPL